MQAKRKVPPHGTLKKESSSNTSNPDSTNSQSHYKLNDIILVVTYLPFVIRYVFITCLLVVALSIPSHAGILQPITSPTTLILEEGEKDGVTLVVWADISASFANGAFPKVTLEQLKECMHYIDQTGGKLYLGIIGARSTEQLILYTSEKSGKSRLPIQKESETSEEYLQRLITYKKAQKRSAYKKDQEQIRQSFLDQASSLLDYNPNRLHQSSQICTSVNLSQKIFSESIQEESHHVVMYVSDGWNNDGVRCKFLLPSTTKVLVVNKLDEDGIFMLYKREKFAMVESALEHIFSTY